MPNEPRPAAEKRPDRAVKRHNAQTDHEGSPHRPQEFQRGKATDTAAGPQEPDLTLEQKEVTPEALAKHADAQGTDEPSVPRGRNRDSAMCEDRDHPGRIDKGNDC